MQTSPMVSLLENDKEWTDNFLKKAAALMHSLVMNHAFLDGNKRTAYAIMVRFLNANEHTINATQQEIIDFCLAVDNKGWEARGIRSWLEMNI